MHKRLVTRYAMKSSEAADENQQRIEGVFEEPPRPGQTPSATSSSGWRMTPSCTCRFTTMARTRPTRSLRRLPSHIFKTVMLIAERLPLTNRPHTRWRLRHDDRLTSSEAADDTIPAPLLPLLRVHETANAPPFSTEAVGIEGGPCLRAAAQRTMSSSPRRRAGDGGAGRTREARSRTPACRDHGALLVLACRGRSRRPLRRGGAPTLIHRSATCFAEADLRDRSARTRSSRRRPARSSA